MISEDLHKLRDILKELQTARTKANEVNQTCKFCYQEPDHKAVVNIYGFAIGYAIGGLERILNTDVN